MFLPIATAAALALAPITSLPTAVWQVAPEVKVKKDGDPVEIRKTKPRAVLLIHGLLLHPLRPEKATKPERHEWQEPKADLVKALASDFDVFGFGYAQTVALDAVSVGRGLREAVEKLKKSGYSEIVLVGHSAGGIIGRQFAERYPDSGVTKVIQIAAPNVGSDLANISIGLPRTQVPFIKSLAPKPRSEVTASAKPLPKSLEACCIVCKVRGIGGDTLVGLESQWPEDLRKQGVPATLVAVNHFDAMKAPQAVSVIAEMAREKLVRWDGEQTAEAEKIVFGKDADAAAVRKDRGRPRIGGR